MIIKVIITAFLSIYAYYFTMRFNMHMFQLNGYKNNEQIAWLKKNLRQQWVLIFGLIIGILNLFIDFIVFDIFTWLILLLIIVVYKALKRIYNKKKLVFTSRVKRMLVCNIALCVIALILIYFLSDMKYLRGSFVILACLQLVMNIIVNVINHPIEVLIKKHYINDAKRKLRANKNLKVIGITGSYGKTSVKFYLQTLLQEKYSVLVTPESYNTPMGVVKTIRGSLKSTHEIFLCEMGARYVGDIKEICDIVHPEHGIITSIGPQHLETFLKMENIQSTKFELAEALPKDGMLFLNGDNKYINQKADEFNKNKVFYYSETDGNGYCAKDIKVSQLGTEFSVVSPKGECERFQTRLIGAHNVINIVGAIAVANKLGISMKDLKVPVRRIQPVEHRMQMREHGTVTIIDDAYNSNPVGSKAAVETLAMFEGIRILITPGMVELGTEENKYNYMFGTYAADCCDYILLVGKKRTEPIKEGALSKGFRSDRCMEFDTLQEAVSYAYAIKGQGHKYILLENDLPDNY